MVQPAGYNPLFSAEYATLVAGARPPIVFDIDRADKPALPLLGYGVIFDNARRTVVVLDPPPPRAWVACCLWPGTAIDVRQPEFPRHECVASPAATIRENPAPPGPARVLDEWGGWAWFEAEGPGWLVTTIPWYPGWSAEVDGRPSPVVVLDGALVGVQLEPGRAAVTLSYWPTGLTPGLIFTFISLVSLGLLADRRLEDLAKRWIQR
ncbi:MAG: YfhO family protein [Chloroflexota bacterium]